MGEATRRDVPGCGETVIICASSDMATKSLHFKQMKMPRLCDEVHLMHAVKLITVPHPTTVRVKYVQDSPLSNRGILAV
jgi:hypothetical protein